MTNLKERAIATHCAITHDQQIQQIHIDNARRDGYAAALNAAIGDDLFFAADGEPSIEVTERWRNIYHGPQSRIDVYDVVTDGSVDVGILTQQRAGGVRTKYALLTVCKGGCGAYVATELAGLYFDGAYVGTELPGLHFADEQDENFARLVEKLGKALAEAEDAICADCEWSPCRTCGHVR